MQYDDFDNFIKNLTNELYNKINEQKEKIIIDMIFWINNGGFETYDEYVKFVNKNNNSEFDVIQKDNYNSYQFNLSVPIPLFSEKLYNYIKKYSIWKENKR